MIKNTAIVLSVVFMAACNNSGKTGENKTGTDTTKPKTAMNVLTDAQKADGWQLLFDGQTTKGWHKYGGEAVGSAWKIADGALYLDTTQKDNWQIKGGGDIASDEEFENFHLKLEWRIAKDGNSGIMFNVHEDSTKYKYPWETGPEMQVLDNDGHEDGKIKKHRAGDLYDLISCSKETVKPVGEWNEAEIKCQNGKLDFYLNGENVVSTELWTDAWKELLKTSKWKGYKDFATYKKGHIALQDHGCMVWYRNIMIKRL
jgi:hypothetical protein